jgi:D-alanyl-D-alanine carboxypeptidase/D-alanyl-D-alanine-endopeptidase (penicillin-binding protein 4)
MPPVPLASRRRAAALATALAASSALFSFSASSRCEPAPAATSVGREPTLDEALEHLTATTRGWGATVGVSIVEVATGRVLAARDADAPKNPASNAKLATAVAALRLLGGDRRLHTGLYGEVRGGDVEELVLRGQGDPSLTSADLAGLARDLARAGARSVGELLVDQSYFDERFVPPAFEQQPNEWAAFRAPIAAVSVDRNAVTFMVRPGEAGGAAAVEVEPPGFVELTGSVRTGARMAAEEVTIELTPAGARLRARVGGIVPQGGRVVRLARRVDDPRLFAGHVLRAALAAEGVVVRGGVRAGGAGATALLASHRSAPLAALLAELGKASDNYYAEMLFQQLGARALGAPATAEAAAAAVTRHLTETGILGPGDVVRNGSGLFDANRLSPATLTRLLRAAYRDPAVGPELVAGLAIGGVDGTLRGRFAALRERRAIRAKTGTLDAVSALSGYVLGPPGREPIAFSILVNGASGKQRESRAAIDAVVDAAARVLWAP